MEVLDRLLHDPDLQEYLAVIKGIRNGLVYGVKIRFPHALVMSILFGRGSWRDRLIIVFRATRQHATRLASFVALYKMLLLLQRKANGGVQRRADTFFAGLLGGYTVFGDRNAINEQIVLYVCSRVVASFIPRQSKPALDPGRTDLASKSVPPDARLFSLFAALSWGAVMWCFKERPETIQPGMASSMRYLYLDSEKWKDLRTFLWHNK